MTRNQASGGLSVRVARSQARRHRAAETRAEGPAPGVPPGGPAAGRPGAGPPCCAVVDAIRCCPYPVIWVQALTHCWNGTQSFLPLPHWASGVFQNLIVWK